MRRVGGVRQGPPHDNRRNGMLEDQLLLSVGLQNNGVFVEGAYTARQLYSAKKVNRDVQAFLASRIQEGILYILRRLAAVHSRSPYGSLTCAIQSPKLQRVPVRHRTRDMGGQNLPFRSPL